MGFTEAIRTCLGNYAKFDGRARRPEFWWFYLFNQLVGGIPVGLGVVLLMIGALSDPVSTPLIVLGSVLLGLGLIVALALLVPVLAVGSRRLHDRGLSGWLQLLLVISIANLVVIILWALPGDSGENAYGPAT